MIPLAHGGNLLIDLPLYGIPIIGVILALAISTARSRRGRSRTHAPARSRRPR